jgi:hypothetical protein
VMQADLARHREDARDLPARDCAPSIACVLGAGLRRPATWSRAPHS